MVFLLCTDSLMAVARVVSLQVSLPPAVLRVTLELHGRQKASGVGDDIAWQHQISTLYAASVGTLDKETTAVVQPLLWNCFHLMHTQNSNNVVAQTYDKSRESSPAAIKYITLSAPGLSSRAISLCTHTQSLGDKFFMHTRILHHLMNRE